MAYNYLQYTKIKFDPNIRQIVPDIRAADVWEYMQDYPPEKEALSAYVAVNTNGEVWHLFNAERISLGRMAAMIANFIRGKHKPQYCPNRFDLGDKCVVVNASKVKVTGQKKS